MGICARKNGVRVVGYIALLLVPSVACFGGSGSGSGGAGAVATATIGPGGGSFGAQGVRITIPSGALADERNFTLQVSAGPELDVEPDTEFLVPVRVDLSEPAWAPGEGATVLRRIDGEFYAVAEIEPGGTSFEVTGFTVLRVRTHATCGQKWEIGDASPSRNESAQTGERDPTRIEGIRNAALRNEADPCLVDIRHMRPELSRSDPVSLGKGTCDGKAKSAAERDAPCGAVAGRNAATGTCKMGRCTYKNEKCVWWEPCTAATCTVAKCTYERNKSEPFLMSRPAAAALSRAQDRVRDALGPDWKIWINGGLDASGRFHEPDSYHAYGAALDLSLCKSPCTQKASQADLDKHLATLSKQLAGAGFDWVHYEDDRHVHVSIASPDCGVTATSQHMQPVACFPDAGITTGGMGGIGGAGAGGTGGTSAGTGGTGDAGVDAGSPDGGIPAGPCGGVSGTWTISCPEGGPGCNPNPGCSPVIGYTATLSIPTDVALSGGSFPEGERTYTFNPGDCTLSYTLDSPCGMIGGSFQLLDGTGSGAGAYYCFTIETNACECTQQRPMNSCSILQAGR